MVIVSTVKSVVMKTSGSAIVISLFPALVDYPNLLSCKLNDRGDAKEPAPLKSQGGKKAVDNSRISARRELAPLCQIH